LKRRFGPDVPRVAFEPEAGDAEAERRQRALQHIENAGLGGCHRGAADEIGKQCDGIDRRW
jgi:hypothetical protein